MYIILNHSVEKNDDLRNPFGSWHYLALTQTYQLVALLASPNQDKSLKLTCYSLDGFPSSFYDYKQSFIN
jgi:hypothetical protein